MLSICLFDLRQSFYSRLAWITLCSSYCPWTLDAHGPASWVLVLVTCSGYFLTVCITISMAPLWLLNVELIRSPFILFIEFSRTGGKTGVRGILNQIQTERLSSFLMPLESLRVPLQRLTVVLTHSSPVCPASIIDTDAAGNFLLGMIHARLQRVESDALFSSHFLGLPLPCSFFLSHTSFPAWFRVVGRLHLTFRDLWSIWRLKLSLLPAASVESKKEKAECWLAPGLPGKLSKDFTMHWSFFIQAVCYVMLHQTSNLNSPGLEEPFGDVLITSHK